jgi:hypothetical protein
MHRGLGLDLYVSDYEFEKRSEARGRGSVEDLYSIFTAALVIFDYL